MPQSGRKAEQLVIMYRDLIVREHKALHAAAIAALPQDGGHHGGEGDTEAVLVGPLAGEALLSQVLEVHNEGLDVGKQAGEDVDGAEAAVGDLPHQQVPQGEGGEQLGAHQLQDGGGLRLGQPGLDVEGPLLVVGRR